MFLRFTLETSIMAQRPRSCRNTSKAAARSNGSVVVRCRCNAMMIISFRITIMVDKYSGHPKGFAYIEFGDEAAVSGTASSHKFIECLH